MAHTSSPQVLQLLGACPIPVGHRVEVQFFYAPRGGGLFGGGAPVPDLENPLVTDLETGVRYGMFPHFHQQIRVWDGQAFALSPDPLPELREHSRWSGTVRKCNVVATRWQRREIQTTVVVELDEAG